MLTGEPTNLKGGPAPAAELGAAARGASAGTPQAGAPGSVTASGELTTADGRRAQVSWQLPEEVPVALLINSVPYTVMMATPANLAEFGRGFLIAEGMVRDASDIKGALVLPADTGSDVTRGFAVDLAVDERAMARAAPRRSVEGRSGCGLCGIEEIGDAVRAPFKLERSFTPSPRAILRAAAALPTLQVMNRANRSVHGAAWVTANGEIVSVREDVGRHNALDKLIGALTSAGTDVTGGFVLMTSRCSFELVQKAATARIPALVTISAPTSLALELARGYGLYLASLGAGGVVEFNS